MIVSRAAFLGRCTRVVSLLLVCSLCFTVLNSEIFTVESKVVNSPVFSKKISGAHAVNAQNTEHSMASEPTSLIRANNVSLVDPAPSEETFSRYYVPADNVPQLSYLMTSNNTIRLKNGGAIVSLPEERHLQLQNVNHEGGARTFTFLSLAPPVTPGAQVYSAVYDLRSLSRPGLKNTFKWAFAYLERGSNIKFEEYDPKRPAVWYTKVWETGGGCQSTLGMGGTMSLGPECENPSSILHEILHSLGMIHEHQRIDRNEYLSVPGYAEASSWKGAISIEERSAVLTPYDYASIMHYTDTLPGVGIIFTLREKKYTKVAQGMRISLSSCDWAALNTLYPGKRKPFPCYPHKVHQFLFPVENQDVIVPNDECLYNNNYYFTKQWCVSKSKKGFPYLPTLQEELGFDPFKENKKKTPNRPPVKTKNTTSTSRGSGKTHTSKPTAGNSETKKTKTLTDVTATRTTAPARKRITTKIETSAEYTTGESDVPTEESTLEIDEVTSPEEDTTINVMLNRRIRRYHGFTYESCASLISLDPSVLDDKQCLRACLEGCSENFPGKSLQECMSIGYYICVPSDVFISSGLRLASSTLTHVILLAFLWRLLK